MSFGEMYTAFTDNWNATRAVIAAGCVLVLSTGYGAVESLPAGDVILTKTRLVGASSSGKTFRGAADGSTRLSAGLAITGWADRGGGVWGAKLPKGADGRPLYTECLFINGRRAQRSRYPADGGFFHVTSVKQYVCAASATTNRIAVGVDMNRPEGKLLAAAKPEELAFAQLLSHIKWDVARTPIESFAGGKVVVDAQPMKSYNTWTPNDFYALENVRGAFTEPGQWFYDGLAGEILYRPLKGETIHDAIVPTPGLEMLLSVRGAKDITFENVTFAFSAPTGAKGPTRLSPYQAAAEASTAAVLVEHSTNVVFRNCRFEHLGNYAIWFREGCRGGGAFGCEMTDLGAGGVRLGRHRPQPSSNMTSRPVDCTNDVAYVETAPWMTRGIVVEDCLIAHGGRFHPSGVGVLLAHASDCTIVHNDIFDLFYTGVSVGWVWGYSGSPAQRNTVAFNHIHDIGQSKLADMGGIYLLGTAFGTCVSNNVIHGIHTYSYGGWGLYPDEGSEGLVLENNLVYETDDASFHQHYGKDNVLRNNILVDSKAGQIAVSRSEPHRSITAERNLVLWSAGGAFQKYGGTKDETSKIDWRSNLWWRVDGKESFNGTSFAAWQKRVKDIGSVFADPGFADWQRRDFTLRPDSPAFKVGFKPFDPSQAGRRGQKSAAAAEF